VVVLLTIDGAQVPGIDSTELVGSNGAVAPTQRVLGSEKLGTKFGVTMTVVE
jgi:hypothetical protein